MSLTLQTTTNVDTKHNSNPMHSIMASEDDRRDGRKNVIGSIETKDDSLFTSTRNNISLENCWQPIHKSEECDQQMGTAGTDEIITKGWACAPNSETEDDVRTSSSSCSEEPSESSCLDKEVSRLKVLKSYLGVLDSDHGNKFERYTSLASRIFRVPMALVTIADLDKQYFISSRGLDCTTMSKSPFCSFTVSMDCDLLVVPDASKDCRFAEDPHVTGYPNVRFYAGAPLVCPDGYRLGTICVMDTESRQEVSLEEKQSLMELAAMVMDTLVDLRRTKQHEMKEGSQHIACTAHDLLTPLTGIALSLSLLKEDESLQSKLTDQQKDMIDTAANCSAVMNSICHKTMDLFRDDEKSKETRCEPRKGVSQTNGPTTVRVADLVKNLNMVIEPFPKRVPIIITVDPSVPPEFVSDDMKIFRSATNFLTNACVKTESGSIHLRISARENADHQQELVFECEDTGPGVDVAKYAYLFKHVREESDPLRVSGTPTLLTEVPSGACRAGVQNTGLGLYSVATQVSSIGGKYGFRPRGLAEGGGSSEPKGTGSVFWFTIPLVLPDKMDGAEGEDLESSNYEEQQPRLTAQQKLNIERLNNLSARSSRLLGTALTIPNTSPTRRLERISSQVGLKKLRSEDALEAYAYAAKASRKGASLNMGNNKRNYSAMSKRMNQALVIEDSLVVRKSLARVLTKLGFEVTQAVNGMEGLKDLKSSLFDLVLCDFLMPVMDGLDCIQQYRQWEKVNRPYFKQYIVGISAHASKKDVEQGLKVGMNDFRSKPVTYDQLTELKNCKQFIQSSAELDNLEVEIEHLKRRKIQNCILPTPVNTAEQRVCLVIEVTPLITNLAKVATERIGWKVVSVNDPEDALGLLKMRNWDTVLVDDDLGCSRCISMFREWEKTHRVNRQKNVALMSANYVSPGKSGVSFQVPTGFDGALGKPIQLDLLQSFLQAATTSCDIVTR